MVPAGGACLTEAHTVAWTTMTFEQQRTVRVGAVEFGNALPLMLIAGPCQMESRAHALETAQAALKEIAAARVGIGLVYKTQL